MKTPKGGKRKSKGKKAKAKAKSARAVSPRSLVKMAYGKVKQKLEAEQNGSSEAIDDLMKLVKLGKELTGDKKEQAGEKKDGEETDGKDVNVRWDKGEKSSNEQ